MDTRHISKASLVLTCWILSSYLSMASAESVRTAEELIRFYGASIESTGAGSAERGLQISTQDADRGIAGVRQGRTSSQAQAALNPSAATQKSQAASVKAVQQNPAALVAGKDKVDFYNLSFARNSYAIPAQSYRQLDELGVALLSLTQSFSDLKFVIEGHTDSLGGAEKNRVLSQNRANAIRRYLLVKHSIDSVHLEAVGVGEYQPLASNATREGRRLNRRVSIKKTRRP